jgi:transposase
VLPPSIARALKLNSRLAPQRYEDVTVLFCDVVGFTAYSENILRRPSLPNWRRWSTASRRLRRGTVTKISRPWAMPLWQSRLHIREAGAKRRRSGLWLSGLRGEDSIAELCRREGIVQNLYYRWSKEFLEAGKKRLAGDTARAATSDEVKELRREASALKEVVAELTLENRLLKKSVIGVREDGA